MALNKGIIFINSKIFYIIIISLFIVLSCQYYKKKDLILFDFESEEELEQIHWQCHTLLSISNEHFSHGNNSLKMELFPSKYPGLAPKLSNNNWKGYSALQFNIFNPQLNEIHITVRIDDRKNYPSYEDRYNKGFTIKPGMNQINIPLNSLITSSTKRWLNLKEIYRLLLFTNRLETKITLYIDYIRLIT